jgi:DNA repair protein RecO
MTVDKTKAFVLQATPYRESSCLVYLYSDRHGLVHGIAKGVRGKKAGQFCLERGFLVELLLYAKPHRELHTIAGVSVVGFYPGIRTNLYKNAVRDVAFEVIMKSMSTDAPHSDVFDYLSNFLYCMERLPPQRCFPAMVWRFLYDFSSLMGFGPNIETCAKCGAPLAAMPGAHLQLECGTFQCSGCSARPPSGGNFVPASVLASLSDRFDSDPLEKRRISVAEARRIVNLFVRFCRYHFQTRSEFKSIDFLDSLFAPPMRESVTPVAGCLSR